MAGGLLGGKGKGLAVMDAATRRAAVRGLTCRTRRTAVWGLTRVKWGRGIYYFLLSIYYLGMRTAGMRQAAIN